MKRSRDAPTNHRAAAAWPAHRFTPSRLQFEFDDDARSHSECGIVSEDIVCCVCAAVCLPSDPAVHGLGHLQAHVPCLRSLIAPVSFPAFVTLCESHAQFTCWPYDGKGVEAGAPELLQVAAEPSAVFRICMARLQQRRPAPSQPLALPANFAAAAAMLRDSERPWPSFPYMSALQAALYGCDIMLQPCPDSGMRLFFKGGVLDSAEVSCIGEPILPPMKCCSPGCRMHCDFRDFFKLGWLVHAHSRDEAAGGAMGLLCTCALHAYSTLPSTFLRPVLPTPPRADVDFPTVDLYDCVQLESEGRCGVCLSSASSATDALLLCASCGVACHQSCCDANQVPAGNWYCHVCASGLQRERQRCCACPVAFGVLQYAQPPELFIHTACATALLGTRPLPSHPVRAYVAADSNVQSNPCCGCGSRTGLRVSCRGRGCMLCAHAVCALAQGWLQQPHSKWLCAVHNDSPRVPRDSAFEHKVGGVDGASRIVMSLSDNTSLSESCVAPAPISHVSRSREKKQNQSHPDLSDEIKSQGIHKSVNWAEVGAVPYNSPSVTFPTPFSVIDAIFKLVQCPPSDVMNADFFPKCPSTVSAALSLSAASAAAAEYDDSWTAEQDRELVVAIRDVGSSSWSAVAQSLSCSRSRKECKRRWGQLQLTQTCTSGDGSSAIDDDLFHAACRALSKPFVFDASPHCGVDVPPSSRMSHKRQSLLFTSNSNIYTCHLTPMQRFGVVVLAMMAQRQLQTTGTVTQIAWDCVINAFNAVIDAVLCSSGSNSIQGDDNCCPARSALSGAFAVLSWLHRRACAAGGGSSRMLVVIGNTFFNSGTAATTDANMFSLKSLFVSSEFNKNPIPLVAVALNRVDEAVINKDDAIVVLHGDRSSVMHAEECIRRAAPRDYSRPLSHILPVVGLSDVVGPRSCLQSMTVHQCSAVTSCLLAAALRGVHIFEIPSFLSRPESVQDAILTSAAASARLVQLMIEQFKDDRSCSNDDDAENARSDAFDESNDVDCNSKRHGALIDAQTPAAAACRVCFCLATNGSFPLTSSIIETRSIVFKTISTAIFAWKCSCDSLASWLLTASQVDLFWKRASQHAVSMMRHPGLQADMALCRFGDRPRRVGNVSFEALGVFVASNQDACATGSAPDVVPSIPLGAGGRVVRSFWDAATGRHRCIWVTECLYNHQGAAVFFCYGRSGMHDMFVGSSAAEAWNLARNHILSSCKDGNSLIDMTCDVGNWLRFQDSQILAEAKFIISSDEFFHESACQSSYARSPGFVFAPIPPIETLASAETLSLSARFDRVFSPAATRHGVVLIDLNESGYVDVKLVGSQTARRVPINLDDGAIIECWGFYSVAYAAAGGFVSIQNAYAPLVNFKSVRILRPSGSDAVEFLNCVVIEAGSLVYKIVAKCGFQQVEFVGNSEVNAFSSLLQHRAFASLLRATTGASTASTWFGTASPIVVAAREMAARAADTVAVTISKGGTPGFAWFVKTLPYEALAPQSSHLNSVKAVNGINHDLSRIKYKAVNHSLGRQVNSDAVVFAQSKGSSAIIQHAPSSRYPSRRIIRRGPSMLLPNRYVLLQLDCLDSSPAFQLTVYENPPVSYVGESISAVMGIYFQSVSKFRSFEVSEMMAASRHWTGQSAGLFGCDILRPSTKHMIFCAPDIIDVDASYMYKLPDQGICSVESDCRVNILSFGIGRVIMGHASVLHGPLPGFCSVTTDREGRAYVYICQDEEVHWVHILEHADGPAVLSFFGRSFQSIQSIVQNSSIDLPCDDLFGFHRARQKFLLPLITQISLQSDDLAELDVHSPSDADLDFGMALFDIQDESSRTTFSDRQHTSLNSIYPHIGETFEVSGNICSSSFQIRSAGMILKGQKLVYVNGLPVSQNFHSAGVLTFCNGRKSSFECTTLYTSSQGNVLIKVALGEEGVVLRFTENSFLPGHLFSFFGVSSAVYEPQSVSHSGGDLMMKIFGLAHVFSQRSVLGVIELLMPSYVVSVIRNVPSAYDLPSNEIDLDVFLSSPHRSSGITVERWGSARQDLIMEGLIIPLGYQSIRTLPDGRNVRCEVEASSGPAQHPKAVSVQFSVSQVCADGAASRKFVASSPQEAWFAFLGLDFDGGGLHRFLERCGYNRCNGMVLFGLGVSHIQSLIHFICKTSVWEQEANSADDGFTEQEDRSDSFMSPFAACEKRQSRLFSDAISRHTQTFLTWLESKRPQPPLKQSVLGDLAPSEQLEHQDAAELWKNVIQRDYGDYKEMVQRDFA